MAKKIKFGTTKLEELPAILQMNWDELHSKRARLFPKGNSEHETSIVSVFLASLGAVKEYREELLTTIGINKIKNKNIQIHIYLEIQNGNSAGRPDALIVITSGKNPVIEWAGFVEAKVGNNILEKKQIELYADFADEIGITDIITISNQLVTTPFDSPVTLRRRKFNLYHWSWAYLKVIAKRLIVIDEVEDEDHVFILSELRRFFDDSNKLSNFVDMGNEWKENANLLYESDSGSKVKTEVVDNILNAYIQEEKDNALQLTDKSTSLVELIVKKDRYEELENMLQKNRCVLSQYMLDKDKNKTFKIEVDFKGLSIKCSTQVIIEKGKAQAQTTALIKLLENASGYTDGIFINAIYIRNKSIDTIGQSLETLINERNDITNTHYSILDKELGDSVKYFEIYTKNILGKRFYGKKTFIDDYESFSERFLNQVVNYI